MTNNCLICLTNSDQVNYNNLCSFCDNCNICDVCYKTRGVHAMLNCPICRKKFNHIEKRNICQLILHTSWYFYQLILYIIFIILPPNIVYGLYLDDDTLKKNSKYMFSQKHLFFLFFNFIHLFITPFVFHFFKYNNAMDIVSYLYFTTNCGICFFSIFDINNGYFAYNVYYLYIINLFFISLLLIINNLMFYNYTIKQFRTYIATIKSKYIPIISKKENVNTSEVVSNTIYVPEINTSSV